MYDVIPDLSYKPSNDFTTVCDMTIHTGTTGYLSDAIQEHGDLLPDLHFLLSRRWLYFAQLRPCLQICTLCSLTTYASPFCCIGETYAGMLRWLVLT